MKIYVDPNNQAAIAEVYKYHPNAEIVDSVEKADTFFVALECEPVGLLTKVRYLLDEIYYLFAKACRQLRRIHHDTQNS